MQINLQHNIVYICKKTTTTQQRTENTMYIKQIIAEKQIHIIIITVQE